MKIVIVSTALATDGSASGVLIGNLIDALRGRGVGVSCLTVKRSLCDADVTEYRGAVLHHVNYIDGLRHGRMPVRDLVHTVRRAVRIRRVKKSAFDPLLVCRLSRKLRILIADADAVIAVCSCYDAAAAMLRAVGDTETATVLFKFDPLSGNVSYRAKDPEMLARYERRLVEECDLVFAPPFIRRFIPDDIREKVQAAELPALTEKRCAPHSEHKDEILCVYSGDFFSGIREPEFMLELFARFTDPRIKLCVLSGRERERFIPYENGALAGRLNVVGHVGERECEKILESADVFVNVGNLVPNQLPSKLFSYMSRGGVILNIHTLPDCPTLDYTKDYPLALNVQASLPVTDESAHDVERWILANLDERVPFETVRRTFGRCTPEYVADEILSAISHLQEQDTEVTR